MVSEEENPLFRCEHNIKHNHAHLRASDCGLSTSERTSHYGENCYLSKSRNLHLFIEDIVAGEMFFYEHLASSSSLSLSLERERYTSASSHIIFSMSRFRMLASVTSNALILMVTVESIESNSFAPVDFHGWLVVLYIE